MGLACCYDLSGMHMVRASCASTAMLRRLQLSDSTDLPAMLTVHSWQELVRAATVNCARLFMQDHELGRVEVRVFLLDIVQRPMHVPPGQRLWQSRCALSGTCSAFQPCHLPRPPCLRSCFFSKDQTGIVSHSTHLSVPISIIYHRRVTSQTCCLWRAIRWRTFRCCSSRSSGLS